MVTLGEPPPPTTTCDAAGNAIVVAPANPTIQKTAYNMRRADETGANACVLINTIVLLLR